MVEPYAWGAQGGILHGASELTGALLGYPLQVHEARQREELRKQQAARQELEDAFMRQRMDQATTAFGWQEQDRPGEQAALALEREARENELAFLGRHDAGEPGYGPLPPPRTLIPPRGMLGPDGEVATEPQIIQPPAPRLPMTFTQQRAAEGAEARKLAAQRAQAEIAGIEALAESREARRPTGGTGAGPRLTPQQLWQRAIQLGDREAGVDDEGRQLRGNPERIRAIYAELSAAQGDAPAAPGAAGAFIPAAPGRRAAPAAAPGTVDPARRAAISNEAAPLMAQVLELMDAGDPTEAQNLLRDIEDPQVREAVIQGLRQIATLRTETPALPAPAAPAAAFSPSTRPDIGIYGGYAP